jgi:hypothetical protein
LGEIFVTTYVPTLASFTTLARLRMAFKLSVFLQITIETKHTSDEEVHRQGQPFWMRRLRGREDRKLRGLERVKAVEEVSDLGGIKRGWGGEGLMC